MLIKMKESKGFTLVELMIVVAIIGILAAVAVPFYQRYVQKSRIAADIMPTIHSVETNIATFYSTQNRFGTTLSTFLQDASTQYVTPALRAGSVNIVDFTIINTARYPQLANRTITARATTVNRSVVWTLSGGVVDELGLK